ncbi:MAG: O-antigen ligase family protein [Bacteroidota bacterium]
MLELIDKLPFRKIHLFAVGLLVLSIPLNKVTTSITCLILMGSWFVERDFKTKFRNIWKNKSSILFALVLLIHVIGLLYTDDFHYAWNDIRIKVPLLLGLLFASYPRFNFKQFHTVLLLYIFAVFAGTIISLYIYYVKGISDTRHITPFISHIRFSLNVCFSIFILFYFMIFVKQFNWSLKILIGFAIAWFVFYLVILRSSTGFLALGGSMLVSILYFSITTKKLYLKISLIGLAILLPLSGYLLLRSVFTSYSTAEPVDISKLDQTTALGNRYDHDTSTYPVENGKYVGLYIAYYELWEAWEKRADIPFFGKDADGQDIRFTLIRYLNSKGYRKDAQGVNLLTKDEIESIKKGNATVSQMQHKGIQSLIEEFMWGYKMYTMSGNPNGSSMMQRYEYLKASIHLIKKYWFFGTGTGDIQHAFNQYYTETDSPLLPELRLRAHNQFLSIFITFGIMGFLLFIAAVFYPPYACKKYSNYLFLMFFVISFISMLTDDTIETQAGVSFFSFFTGFLLYASPESDSYQSI